MTNRDEARRALLDILNRIDELQVDRLLIAMTSDTGQVLFGGSKLDTVSVIGIVETVKNMALSNTAKSFTPFAQMSATSPKPS